MERRKFYTVVCIAVSVVLLVSNFCFAKYSGGEGSSENPYQISSPNDLITLGNTPADYNSCFVLANDINLAGYTFDKAVISPDIDNTNYDFDGTAFGGVFDGNGHSIISLTIDANGLNNSYLGLLGNISSNGFVKNLGIEDVNIIDGEYSSYTGGLCGINAGSIINCYSTGSVSGYMGIGGLCGFNYNGIITNCYSTGTVNGHWGIGGLCGENYEGSIVNCYSTGNVSGNMRGNEDVGGLCGFNYDSCIANCYSTGSVSGGYATGGLCGMNGGSSITNCYSTGNVRGGDRTGGLCGENRDSITNCYSTGIVIGTTNTGGLVGFNEEGSYISCYFLDMAGVDNGFGEPLNDEQMKQQASFTGWDFFGESANGTSSYWTMKSSSYPQLYIFDSNFMPYEFDGQGTAANPYLIYDVNDIGAVWQKPYSCYKLINDIDLDGIQWSVAVIQCFVGSLDGDNHIISNLSISGGLYLGLFGKISFDTTIKNIGIENINIAGTEKCVGGLCGWNYGGRIANCYSTGTVTGNFRIGGLCGFNYEGGNITNCYSTCNATGIFSTGGLCGANANNSGIANCYSIGAVTGSSSLGGLCGYNYNSSCITGCYSTGAVSGDEGGTGGLCGDNTNDNGSFASCYFLETAGPDNGAGEPITDTQMKQQASFIDWDFSYTDGDEADWFMAFDGYPILPWQISPADIYTDGKNNLKDWAVFAGYWQRDDCAPYNSYCEFADMDFDGDVDVNDLAELMSYWLEEGIY
ncbi:MAG: GLUG motif-containing protein [Phycisphaerae bacterium]|jgi:hypothetical protein